MAGTCRGGVCADRSDDLRGDGQAELDLGVDAVAGAGPLEVVGSKAGHLWDALCRACDSLGFGKATGRDEVFRALVLASIIEPTSKLDTLRVLEQTGVDTVSYRTDADPSSAPLRETLVA